MDNEISMVINGIKIVPDIYVPHHQRVARSLKERLFTRPWRPFDKFKNIDSHIIYIVNGVGIVSYKTFSDLKKTGYLENCKIIGDEEKVALVAKALTSNKQRE